MKGASVIKRTYDMAALVALLNMVALVGVLFVIVGGGAVDGQKVRRITAVLRGEDEIDKTPALEVQADAVEDSKTTVADEDASTTSQMELEIMRREADRIQEELRQRLTLNNTILLRVTAEREAFKTERDTAAQREQAAVVEKETQGFEKQIAIYENLAPKTAVQHLLGLQDPDEAARILIALKTRKAKKIVEAAKGDIQSRQMMTILRRLREVAPGRSVDLVDG
jgi:hypothetical protein